MVEIEIDGKKVQAKSGSMLIAAADAAGTYIPHFCYHKKLSIAANCRMCLVDVEKAPKPMPACATPVTQGMIVRSRSDKAVSAQKSVMEFLLINHPLDCPICDQGGECQLQDLAVGYGPDASSYKEEKRVVTPKDVGPLISMQEMNRCIQCTRCVRFGQEIAGVMELGMIGRGEHSEIVSFVGKTVDSELSGNMIDLCPVGALTSKPFRYSARTWELARRKSVAPHDGLGSNLVVQVKQNAVMRVLPLENESINECWLSDKDRFSYEGLNSEARLTQPMVKRDGQWQETDWQTALEAVVQGLQAAGTSLGVLASPHATLEELYLAQGVARSLGGSIESRLRQSDYSAEGKRRGAPWLGMPVADLSNLDRVLVVGSFLRKDHPLIANRLRQAAKRGTQVSVIHCTGDDLLMRVAHTLVVSPADLPAALASVAEGVSGVAGEIAASLKSGQKIAILLGNFAQQHPQAAQLQAIAQALAAATGATLGFLGEAANSVGAHVAGATGTADPFASPRKAWLLLHAEPELDCANPQAAMAAMRSAGFVVALSAFRHAAADYAQVMLPIAPFTETSGTFINTEGRVQSFHAAVRPLGEARPGWKVLRVLGNLLGLAGFEFDSSEQVKAACIAGRDIASLLSNAIDLQPSAAKPAAGGLQRIAEVPAYFADPLVRRAPSLQRTSDARAPAARLCGKTLAAQGLSEGDLVRVSTAAGQAELKVRKDESVAEGCVRIAAAHASTTGLGAMFGELRLEKLTVQKVA